MSDDSSLEFEEDPYLAFASRGETPSLDSWELPEADLPETELPEADLPESCTVETEPGLRVRFLDLTKPYLPNIPDSSNYTSFLRIAATTETGAVEATTPEGVNELIGLTPEQQEQLRKEWADELAKTEEEIQTLRHVLASKVKATQELKRKLGFSVWREFQDDMSQGIRNVKESHVYQTVEEQVGKISRAVTEAPIYQKTESIVKGTTEKATSILGGLGHGITNKLGQLKNSDSFRSFEERVGSAYENVKGRVTPSRSASAQNFLDSLHEGGERPKSNASTPTIVEEKIIQ